MKILYITDNRIFGSGGGCLECQKYYDALSSYCSKKGFFLQVISLDKNHLELKRKQLVLIKKYRILDFLSRILFHSTFFYFYWLKYKKQIFDFEPDMIFLERSRLGFIAKSFKLQKKKCIITCCLDNVEYDYVNGYFGNKNTLFSKFKIWLEKKCVVRDEKNMFNHADQTIFLTNRDYLRSKELYGYNKKKQILPICLKKAVSLYNFSKKRTFVFVGSLNYESNLDAIRWFLKNIWIPSYSENDSIQLIIAGNNPTKELLDVVLSCKNCVIKKNFDNLANVIPVYSALIAPIQTGAGMKVKVADALSMGAFVIASDEALVGYEESVSLSEAIYRANTPNEVFSAMESFLKKTDDDLQRISEKHKLLYKNFYSYNRSRSFIKNYIDMFLG